MRLTLPLAILFALNSCFAQKTETFGLGHVGNVSVTASSNSPNGIKTLTLDGFLPNHNSASRFLSQATLGPRPAEIENVTVIGEEAWMNQQLALPNSFSTEAYIRSIAQQVADTLNLQDPNREEPYTVENLNLNHDYFDIAWFQGSMTSPDRLRWRMAFALSEIFVASRISSFDNNPYALASYYDVLLEHSLGNYRDLLEAVTFHPTMAVYLTYMNNHAEGIVGGNHVFPDENYAREVMQLFSIGLFELNTDGTEKQDVNGNPIPTYDNDDIGGLAKVFTGLSWHNSDYLGDNTSNEQAYTHPLKFFPIDSSDAYRRPWRSEPDIVDGHDRGPKTFLGQTIPARDPSLGLQDFQDAIDVIFNHPNVGPFICKQLIQRMVTSNPSPSYVQRVAEVFNNNGSGVRGDFKAVLQAILLDREARVIEERNERYSGMLREPFVRYTNLVNALNLTSSIGVYRNDMDEVYEQMGQRPLQSPSVFNFFQTSYTPDGELAEQGKVAPEFQILNSITLTGYLNALAEWLIDNDPIDYYWYGGDTVYKEDEVPEFDFSGDYLFASNKNLPILLDKYNMLLAHGSISETNINHIKTAIEAMPDIYDSNGEIDEIDARRRVALTLFLIMSSPEYIINR
ncbi:DUF1800 domain-containing protein [Jiulongibacter sediminis]|uniref:DUF1800 domain-containing protein n=1 Tax=Jiulongibacter sediminis TaxID=1605367 RepID=UPI0006DC5A4B|nr:DUF1800 domain-containing protein [Jiulongibacter sediminis]